MDTVRIASLATLMSQERTESAVQLAVLKKAMDVQSQGAMQLIQAASQVVPAGSSANPPHLGNTVDLFV